MNNTASNITNNKLDISVAIITFNEEDRIVKTIESVKDFASEIIIIDSNSTDNTVSIAENLGAKVYTENWKGYSAQKNSLIEKCSCQWILFLDADEEVSSTLKENIIKAISNDSNKISGYNIKRKTHYLGKLLNYSWQKDIRLRIVKKDSSPHWVGEVVHESLEIKGVIGTLDGFIIHYSYRNIKDHFNKTIMYAELSAEEYFKKGKKPSLFKLVFNPLFAFIKMYIIKLSFLDGIQGFIAASSAYMYAFLKYAFLWDKYRNKN